jgi:hypothetical protein
VCDCSMVYWRGVKSLANPEAFIAECSLRRLQQA